MVPFARPGRSDPCDVMAERPCAPHLSTRASNPSSSTRRSQGTCTPIRAPASARLVVSASRDSNHQCQQQLRLGIVGALPRATGGARRRGRMRACVGFEEIRPARSIAPSRLIADPLERHRELVATATGDGFGETERALPPALQLFAHSSSGCATELGISDEAFAAMAVKARSHARHNPYAIFRDPLTIDDVLAHHRCSGTCASSTRVRRAVGPPPCSSARREFASAPRAAQRRRAIAQVLMSDTGPDLDHPQHSRCSGPCGDTPRCDARVRTRRRGTGGHRRRRSCTIAS